MQSLVLAVLASVSIAMSSTDGRTGVAPADRAATRPIVAALPTVGAIPPAARPHTVVVSIDRARLEAFANAGGGLLENVPLSPTYTASLALNPVNPLAADAKLEVVGTDAKGRPVVREASVSGAFLAGSST